MNKLRGTRSTGCKGKAGKEGGSKQGQTGTDEKTKGRSRGGWGWADGAENGEERRKCGEHREHREHRERGEQAVEAEKTGNVYRKCTIQKKDRGIASAVFCLLLPVRQGQPPRYYPIRRAAPQGFRPEPVPESQPGASWRAPRSQGHAPEVPWRPSKFRYCSLRRAPCPWRA